MSRPALRLADATDTRCTGFRSGASAICSRRCCWAISSPAPPAPRCRVRPRCWAGWLQGAGQAGGGRGGGRAGHQSPAAVDPQPAGGTGADRAARHRRRPGADDQRPAQCRDRLAADPPGDRGNLPQGDVTGSPAGGGRIQYRSGRGEPPADPRSSSRPPRRRRRPSGRRARRPMPRRRPARWRPTGPSRAMLLGAAAAVLGARMGTRTMVAVRRYA